MIYLLVKTHAYNIWYKQSIHFPIFDLDHKSRFSIQEHNIKLVNVHWFEIRKALKFYKENPRTF
jgi:hypothetical protein